MCVDAENRERADEGQCPNACECTRWVCFTMMRGSAAPLLEAGARQTGIMAESEVYRDSGDVVWAAGRGGTATPIP